MRWAENFPRPPKRCAVLPGVGGYTSGAIAAIAYDEKQAAMDANAERVIARLYAVETPMPKAKVELHALCSALVPERAGDFAQALMDLGSAICTSKRPACPNCPWSSDCLARKQGIQEQLPVKAPKMARPLRRGAAFVARDRTRRGVAGVNVPTRGCWRSMLEPPLGPVGGEFSLRRESAETGAVRRRCGKSAPASCAMASPISNWKREVYVAELSKRPKIRWPLGVRRQVARGRTPDRDAQDRRAWASMMAVRCSR